MNLTLNGEPFAVTLGIITKRRRRLLAQANSERGQALLRLYEEYPDVKAYFEQEAADRPALTDALAIRTALYNARFGDIEEDFNFRVFRGMLVTDGLTPDQAAAVATDIDSEFWGDQLPKEIAEEVARFLGAIAGTE